MNTLENRKKLAKHIFRLLKVTDIVFTIGRTNKGNLGLRFTENSDDYEIYLDAVPLPTKDILVDDNNIELKKMLEKYLFDEEGRLFYPDTKGNQFKDLAGIVDNGTTYVNVGGVKDSQGNDITDKVFGPKKKGGRPKGSKNKPKETKQETPEVVG